MGSRRNVVMLVCGGAVVVLLTAAIIARRPIQREWHTWRFVRGDDETKRAAAPHLVELGALEVVESWYRERFERGDDRVRAEVATELVDIGSRSLAENLYLESLLSGAHERFGPAIDWFKGNGDATTARRLLSRLRLVLESSEIDLHDREEVVQGLFSAISEIAKRESTAAVPVLVEFIEMPSGRPGQDYQARICATYLLAGLGPAASEAIPTLRRHLTDEDKVFRGAIENALRQIRPRR